MHQEPATSQGEIIDPDMAMKIPLVRPFLTTGLQSGILRALGSVLQKPYPSKIIENASRNKQGIKRFYVECSMDDIARELNSGNIVIIHESTDINGKRLNIRDFSSYEVEFVSNAWNSTGLYILGPKNRGNSDQSEISDLYHSVRTRFGTWFRGVNILGNGIRLLMGNGSPLTEQVNFLLTHRQRLAELLDRIERGGHDEIVEYNARLSQNGRDYTILDVLSALRDSSELSQANQNQINSILNPESH